MATESDNKRTDSIRVRLAPEMLERFELIAKRYGMPPATLGAFAIAQFVQQKENELSMSRMAVMQMARQMGETLENVDVEKLLENMVPGMVQAMSQPQLPLDAEAAPGRVGVGDQGTAAARGG